MALLKESIPTASQLLELCTATISANHAEFLDKTAPERLEFEDHKNKLWLGLLYLAIAGMIAVGIFGQNSGWIFSIILPVLGWYLVVIRRFSTAFQRLNLKAKNVVNQYLSTVLQRSVSHQEMVVHYEETIKLFNESELVTETISKLEVDDYYALEQPVPITVRELKATKKTEGKGDQQVVIFCGILAVVTLPKFLNAVTFVSTEGDKFGFGHQNFWTNIIGSGRVKETILEWNDFEKDLHVASSDGIEARYILTPNFMQSLHAWWLEGKENMRIVFRQNRLYVALPNRQVRFSQSVISTDQKKITNYLYSVLLPIWRIVTLVEEIRL